MAYTPFKKALPVWADGLENEKNITLGLYAAVPGGNTVILRVATSGFYRVFINGKFTYYGPARCAEGFFRVDEIPLSLPAGTVHIGIEVINYAINSFGYICAPGFIQAELVQEDTVLAATGDGFSAVQLLERVRRIQRYSYQRPAAESYRLSPDYTAWRVGGSCANASPTTLSVTAEKALVPRRIPLNTFPKTAAQAVEAHGTFKDDVIPAKYLKNRSLTMPADPKHMLMGFAEEELELHLSDRVQEFANTSFEKDMQPYTGSSKVCAKEFVILSLPGAKTGFITADIHCEKEGDLFILFDETLNEGGDVNPNARTCCNVVQLRLQAGDYAFQGMEPFGFKYVKLMATAGAFTVQNFRITELICPCEVTAAYTGKDEKLAAVFEAAKQTFLQSSSDLFMDCPTRERAGWLCDSYFTARAEKEFTGGNVIEYNFLENYLLPETFKDHPKGMVPMCYPSDHYNGSFIPNWAMWLVLELEDRLDRVGDRDFILQFRKRVYDLIDWCKQYENADGLLERLPGWVFVEWSKANDLVQDINFPSNMLYARMLEAAARLFDDAALFKKAAKLKETVRARSFDGEFFVDNEVYENGKPVSTGERTEVCQYYAFFTGVATPEAYPALWKTMVEDFGPQRAETGKHPQIYPANAFIGNYLRLMVLEDNGLYAQLLSEIKGYFYYMAQRTGTLWENIGANASCIHGFASYAVHFIRVAEQHVKGE